jgi:hypothetical protein
VSESPRLANYPAPRKSRFPSVTRPTACKLPLLANLRDHLHSQSAAMGFGLFPELKVTYLISAHRVNPRYLVQLIHDHGFSHRVLRYRLTGAQDPRRKRSTKLVWHLRLLLHGLKNGRFSMQCRQARFRDLNDAARFNSENGVIQLSSSAFFAAGR